jgi:hypothetical protein
VPISYYCDCPLSAACFMVFLGIGSWPLFTVVQGGVRGQPYRPVAGEVPNALRVTLRQSNS